MAPTPKSRKNKMKKSKENLAGVSKRPVRRLFKYNEENLLKAIELIQNKTMGFREACRFYGVPFSTVHDRLSGKVKVDKKPKVGPDPVLGVQGEEKLKRWILDMAKCGFPVNKQDVLESVSKIILKSGAKNPFKEGKPGDTWYQAFLRRHPEVSVREPEGINNARASVTENRVRLWFKDLHEYIKSIDALDVFEDPSRIFNGDETGFSLCPKSGKVLGPRGYKNLYIIKKNNEKENISVLVVFSADGKICPPLVIFPYIRPPKALINNMPQSWVLGRSESGWMRGDVFYEYISNSFHTWLIQNNIKKPILLFIDGHKSHMTFSLSQFCEANGIILYALPPNTTHMLQPADVSVFRPLKQEWKKTVKNWQARDENINQTVTKINFCKILNETLTNIDLKDAIVNGFRKCGLYPFNQNAVDYTKCVKDTQQRIRVSGGNISNKKTVSARDYDTATKVITSIKDELSKQSIDLKIVLAEIEKAKIKFTSSRRSTSKTPRTSAASNLSTSILAVDLPQTSAFSPSDNILNAELKTDASLYTNDQLSQDLSLLDPGSFISLTNISILPLDEMEISQNTPLLAKMQPVSLTTVADIHNENDIVEGDHHLSPPRDMFAALTDTVSLKKTTNIHNENEIIKADHQQPTPKAVLVELSEAVSITTIHDNTDVFEAGHHQAALNDAVSLSTNHDNTDTVEADHNQPPPRHILAPITEILSFDEAFERHIHFPDPPLAPKARSGPKLPSAISSSAWREFYQKKEEEKENKLKEKRIKKELRADAKDRKNKEKDSKIKGKKKAVVKSMPKNVLCKTPENKVIKCSQCSEDLVSDVEDDAEKNIGCDHCVRWFHLKCTVLKQTPYVEAAYSDYICPFCMQ